MDVNKICTVYNMKLDAINYLKHKMFAKLFLLRIEEKTTITLHIINKIESVENNNTNNRTSDIIRQCSRTPRIFEI